MRSVSATANSRSRADGTGWSYSAVCYTRSSTSGGPRRRHRHRPRHVPVGTISALGALQTLDETSARCRNDGSSGCCGRARRDPGPLPPGVRLDGAFDLRGEQLAAAKMSWEEQVYRSAGEPAFKRLTAPAATPAGALIPAHPRIAHGHAAAGQSDEILVVTTEIYRHCRLVEAIRSSHCPFARPSTRSACHPAASVLRWPTNSSPTSASGDPLLDPCPPSPRRSLGMGAPQYRWRHGLTGRAAPRWRRRRARAGRDRPPAPAGARRVRRARAHGHACPHRAAVERRAGSRRMATAISAPRTSVGCIKVVMACLCQTDLASTSSSPRTQVCDGRSADLCR